MPWSETPPYDARDRPPPGSVYAPSPREMPSWLPPRHDPDRFEVRYVSANGGIHWNADWVLTQPGVAVAINVQSATVSLDKTFSPRGEMGRMTRKPWPRPVTMLLTPRA
jgi:hypothetical protein